MCHPIHSKVIFTSLFISGVISSIAFETDHSSADFVKLISVHPVRLGVIDERIKLVRSDIKKLDYNVTRVQNSVDAHTLALNQIIAKLNEIDNKMNQLIADSKTGSLINQPARNRRIVSNRRILVGRSVSNDNYDEYTNEFARNTELDDNQSKLTNEFIQSAYNWQNRTDLKLTKIMNVITEIYKEDKELSLALSKLNERQVNEDRTEIVERMRKEFKEQFSINKVELKSYISNVNENCLRTKTQNENLTFLLLGIKDDLSNPLKTGSKYNQENSVLAPDDESHLADTSNLIGKNEPCKSANQLNSTIELFRTDLNNVKQQIINKLDRENTRINERIFTLNNNYQHLTNLRNCNSTIHKVRQSIDVQNEVDSQSVRSHKVSSTPELASSTFIPPPFYQPPRNDIESRSKSSTRSKLINPIKYGQLKRANCHVPSLLSPASCEDLFTDRVNCDGVYVILIQEEAIRVYCELDNEAGSTVIMRRGQFNDYHLTLFNQDWYNYKKGFGNIDADFWLGLDKIHELTKNKNQMLIIDLETFAGEQMTLKYNKFYVDDEMNNYKLNIGEPTGEGSNFANLFLQHNGASFATLDRNNRFNCARKFEGGWWYFDNNQCHSVLLNGAFYKNSTPMHKDGIQWPNKWPKQYLKSVQMKIRERKFI